MAVMMIWMMVMMMMIINLSEKENQCVYLTHVSTLLSGLHTSFSLIILQELGKKRVTSILHKRNQPPEMLANYPQITQLSKC